MVTPNSSSWRVALLPAVLAIACAGVSGCGGAQKGGSAPTPATLLLDFQPNMVHSGTFLAVQRGYDRAAGVRLHVQIPSSSTDAVKLLRAGRARFAFVDIHDLAIADARGAGLVGVMALVQRPLAAVLAQPGVGRPRELAGRRAGVTGLPSDLAVLRSVVQGDGGDPAKVRTVTIGFQAVPALLSRRVDAATGFWNAEGVALARRRPGTREFRVDDFGAPAYPELLLAATRDTVGSDPALVRATVRALRRGYTAAVAAPAKAVNALVRAAPGTDRATAAAEFAAVRPALVPPGGRFGTLQPALLRRWAAWEARFGIVRRAPDVGAVFDTQFANAP